MSLFSKLTKNNDKSIYPWSQRKLGGGSSAFPRFGHATTTLPSDQLVLYGGMQPNGPAKKDLYLVDASMCFLLKQMDVLLCYLIMLQIMCRSAHLMLLEMYRLLDVSLHLYPFETLHYVSHFYKFIYNHLMQGIF